MRAHERRCASSPCRNVMTILEIEIQELFELVSRAGSLLEHGLRGRRVGDLEQPRAVVADLLQRHQRGRPVDAAIAGRQVIVGLAAVVVEMRRHQMAGAGFDGVAEIAHQERMADVHADADSCPFEVVFDERHQRFGARQLIGDDLERQLHPCPLGASRAAPRCFFALLRGCCPELACATASGTPRWTTRWRNGIVCDNASAASASASVRRRCVSSAIAFENASPHAPSDEAGANRRVHRVQRQPRVVEPFGQRSHGDAVVIVEVACAWRTARRTRTRAPRSRPGVRGRAAGRGTGASRRQSADCSLRSSAAQSPNDYFIELRR